MYIMADKPPLIDIKAVINRIETIAAYLLQPKASSINSTPE